MIQFFVILIFEIRNKIDANYFTKSFIFARILEVFPEIFT